MLACLQGHLLMITHGAVPVLVRATGTSKTGPTLAVTSSSRPRPARTPDPVTPRARHASRHASPEPRRVQRADRKRPRGQAKDQAGLRLGLIFLLGELHAWGRRVCPGECGRERPVARAAEVNRAAGELASSKRTRAAGELGEAEVDRCRRRILAQPKLTVLPENPA